MHCPYLIMIVHSQGNTGALKVVNDHTLLSRSIGRGEDKLQATRAVDYNVSCFVLITECVTSQDDRLRPSRNQSRNVLADDGFAEHSSSEDVSDCALHTNPM